MDAHRHTYWEFYLDSLNDSTLVSLLPFLGKMASSDEAVAASLSGFFSDLERVLLEVVFVRFAERVPGDS